MKVDEVMTRDVQSCKPDTNLAAAAMRMWDGDFGTLPVVDDAGKVLGMITDRDICIAAATRHKDPASLMAGEVVTGQLHSCNAGTDVRDALETFRRARVRRLPVVDDQGILQGILSMNDIVLHATESEKKGKGLSYTDVVNTFKAICLPHGKASAAATRA